MGKNPVSIVLRDGFFEIEDLARACRAHANPEASAFIDLVVAVAGSAVGLCHIGELLSGAWQASTSGAGESLLAQLVHQLGHRLDAIVVHASAGGCDSGDGQGTLPPLPAGDALVLEDTDFSSDYKLDRALFKYVQATREACAGTIVHSVAADKSRVGLQAVMCGALVLPDNRAAWLVPQVFLGTPAPPPFPIGPWFPRQPERCQQNGIRTSVWPSRGKKPVKKHDLRLLYHFARRRFLAICTPS